MIIDLILDRKDGIPYKPRLFYNAVAGYGEIGWNITEKMDSGNETDVKQAIAEYINDNEYSPEIIKWVNSVNWLV